MRGKQGLYLSKTSAVEERTKGLSRSDDTNFGASEDGCERQDAEISRTWGSFDHSICTHSSTQFSDEFSTDNRTFYGGDDAYFQAVDLWYGATQDLEVCYCPFTIWCPER